MTPKVSRCITHPRGKAKCSQANPANQANPVSLASKMAVSLASKLARSNLRLHGVGTQAPLLVDGPTPVAGFNNKDSGSSRSSSLKALASSHNLANSSQAQDTHLSPLLTSQ